MDPIERIDQVFLQLEFAIKLLDYVEKGNVDTELFDVKMIITLPGGTIVLNHNSFQRYDDLVKGAENTYLMTLGSTTIALDCALRDAGFPTTVKALKDCSPRGNLRVLVYMLRCAFAHDMMHPKWEVKGPVKRLLDGNR